MKLVEVHFLTQLGSGSKLSERENKQKPSTQPETAKSYKERKGFFEGQNLFVSMCVRVQRISSVERRCCFTQLFCIQPGKWWSLLLKSVLLIWRNETSDESKERYSNSRSSYTKPLGAFHSWWWYARMKVSKVNFAQDLIQEDFCQADSLSCCLASTMSNWKHKRYYMSSLRIISPPRKVEDKLHWFL